MPMHARWHSAVSCAKMAELIKMPFVLWRRVGPRKHVLHRVHIDATWRIRLNRPCSATLQKWLNQSRCRCLECGLGWTQGGTTYYLWAPITPCQGAIFRGKDMPGMPHNTLSGAVQKWLNQSICCLSCGLGWAKRSTGSVIFARWRQWRAHWRHLANTIEPSICGGDACGLMSNYYDHLLLLWLHCSLQKWWSLLQAVVLMNQTQNFTDIFLIGHQILRRCSLIFLKTSRVFLFVLILLLRLYGRLVFHQLIICILVGT